MSFSLGDLAALVVAMVSLIRAYQMQKQNKAKSEVLVANAAEKYEQIASRSAERIEELERKNTELEARIDQLEREVREKDRVIAEREQQIVELLHGIELLIHQIGARGDTPVWTPKTRKEK